jgi:hypothetical protein
MKEDDLVKSLKSRRQSARGDGFEIRPHYEAYFAAVRRNDEG